MLIDNLNKMNFDKMTPIQQISMPGISKGCDVMGCSKTGSGKTLAFLLPIINSMLKYGAPSEDYNQNYYAYPVALILMPTRELADQVYKETRKIIHNTGINAVKIYGGVGQEQQLRELRYGCDILIATPGRLIDFIKQNVIRLCSVKYFIIDEADRLLDMGFEPQLNSIVFEKDLQDKSKRQNLMFSATFDERVKSIARKFMNEYYYVQINIEKESTNRVVQKLVYSEEDDKVFKLHEILQNISGSVLSKIF
jgi:ATP-dependent RNA helicase DDX3X